jgi:hypothetical protein
MDRRQAIERYYQCYRDRDREGLRSLLAPDMRHVSSFAEYRNRDEMLTDIWPMVGESWATQLEIFGDGSEFMVRYQVQSRERPPTNMAEYVRFDGDRIAEIEVYMGRDPGT